MGLSKTEETGSDITLKKKEISEVLKQASSPLCLSFHFADAANLSSFLKGQHMYTVEREWVDALQLLEVTYRKMGDKILHKQSLDPAVWNRTEAEWLVR